MEKSTSKPDGERLCDWLARRDAKAEAGAEVGLSHVAPPASAIPEMEAYTAWACGRGRQEAAN